MSDEHRSGLSPENYHKLTGFEGDWRDTWWDQNYLVFMAGQLGLYQLNHGLDLGCGVGHWGQRLFPFMAPGAVMVGIDAESEWMDKAQDRARTRGLEGISYRVADATQLPFEDQSFDFVTCQTVLMHVPDAETVVAEGLRVLRPGGLFLAAEPNNFGSSAAELVREPQRDWSIMAALMELDITCAHGKEALGEGWYSIAERLPAMLDRLGFVGIDARLNNQCQPRVPPYEADREAIERIREHHALGALVRAGGTRENGLRMFLAGGGTAERYAELWEIAREHQQQELDAIDSSTYTGAGGHLHYLIWGRKPA